MSLCSEEEDGAAKILVFAKPIDNFCASLHYDRIVDHCTRNDSAVLCHSEHPKGTVEASIQLYLQSKVSINSPGYHPLVNVTFTTNSGVNATVHFSVGTFVPVGGCCTSNYLEFIAVDNGSPGGSQSLGCGGETSQVKTGVLVVVSCFGRLSFSPGTHSVSLVLFGAGPFTVEHGPSTALLLEFD